MPVRELARTLADSLSLYLTLTLCHLGERARRGQPQEQPCGVSTVSRMSWSTPARVPSGRGSWASCSGFLFPPCLQGGLAAMRRPTTHQVLGAGSLLQISPSGRHSHPFLKNRVQSKSRARPCKLYAGLCRSLRTCGYLRAILWILRMLLRFLVLPERGGTGERKKKGDRFLEGGSQVQSRRQSGRTSQRR